MNLKAHLAEKQLTEQGWIDWSKVENDAKDLKTVQFLEEQKKKLNELLAKPITWVINGKQFSAHSDICECAKCLNEIDEAVESSLKT